MYTINAAKRLATLSLVLHARELGLVIRDRTDSSPPKPASHLDQQTQLGKPFSYHSQWLRRHAKASSFTSFMGRIRGLDGIPGYSNFVANSEDLRLDVCLSHRFCQGILAAVPALVLKPLPTLPSNGAWYQAVIMVGYKWGKSPIIAISKY